MKVLIDTNIVLDVLCNRQGLMEASRKVMQLCEVGKINGALCTLSLVNISYIARKQLNRDQIKEIVRQMGLIFHVEDLKQQNLQRAVDSDMKDFEDAVQAECARRIKAQYIVTRNIKDFTESPVPAIKPEELLERIL